MKKFRKILAVLLVSMICINTMDVSAFAKEMYSLDAVSEVETSKQNDWDGITNKSVYEGDGYNVTFSLAEVWENGYNAVVKIENVSDKDIENWSLAFLYSGDISGIWNGVISENQEGRYIIKNATWNQDIEANSYVEFGISGQKSFVGFPTSYEMVSTPSSLNEENYSVEYKLNSDWDNGFTGSISITNNTDSTLEDWVLEFDFKRNITDVWGGVIESRYDDRYVVKNAGYNANIGAGQTVSFGFIGDDNANSEAPSNYNLSTYVLMEADAESEVKLTVNTDEFIYNESADWFIVKDNVNSLSGLLEGADEVTSFTYKITDINSTVIKTGSIKIADSWTIDNFGLALGYNELWMVAVQKNGTVNKFVVKFFNKNNANFERTNADMNDTDGDGINNYYETLLGTDISKVDTDEDQLTDYEEFICVGTDPTLKDTDKDGIFDGEEDKDEDGLTNLMEIKLSTECIIKDTDSDGLSDGDEVNVYHTDPLTWDTDKDTLSDSQDIELKFDPTLMDTDGDGTNDGEEKVYQTYEYNVENKNKSQIVSVEVALECDGYLPSKTVILDTYNLDMRSSEVVGLIGIPVDVSVDTEFDSAKLTFTYDETALGDTSEENLAMMWYDEENDKYVVLDSTVDIINNTVTYSTTHFSTYLIVDKEIWLDNMRMDMNYRNSEEVVYYDMAFVVDASGSMTSARMTTAKAALEKFIDAMMENDRAGLIKFNSYATTLAELTNNKIYLKDRLTTLYGSGGTNADKGMLRGIEVLDSADEKKEKMLILICDGDVAYVQSTVDSAKEKGITIHCINVINGSSTAMQRIASETGGMYYYAATTEDVEKVIANLTDSTVGTVDMTDTDGDGLYDVYETNGMRLSNGQIVYTDPGNVDTDGDGVSDYDAMGGAPVTESFIIDGNTYSCTLNHSVVYGKLSSEFIYVDGTINSDGKQYYGEMSYLPYSYAYLDDKYYTDSETNVYFFGEKRTHYGAARIHKLYADKMPEANYGDYAWGNAMIHLGIAISTMLDMVAVDVFDTYTDGTGGDEGAWLEGFTRKTIVVPNKYILLGVSNSAYDNYMENMARTRKAFEGVLNEYNQEAYISVSPHTQWRGCAYVDYRNFEIRDISDVLCNISAFGTFNSADAGVTAHCKYDPIAETYEMEYYYYLIDFYDYSALDFLQEQDALGFNRSFELYGSLQKLSVKWKKGEDNARFTKMVGIML